LNLIVIWFSLLMLFICPPIFYYLYMKKISAKPWNIKKDENYLPSVTIIVPVYNEETVIDLKLENLKKLDYPKDKLQIIIVDDCSTDKSLQKIFEHKKNWTNVEIQVLSNSERKGKTRSLNSALKKAKGEIIVVSDADCFWPRHILRKAMKFLADPSVGAVAGLERLINPTDSWVTQTEATYNDTIHTIRVGESKLYSTIFFQGGFGAYKRAAFDHFDIYADDSGTALNIVQRGFRALLLPEAVYFTCFPEAWREKIAIKLRRARQLVLIHFRCFKLLLQSKLKLSKKIFLPEAFMHIINPFIFLLLLITYFFMLSEEITFILFPIVLAAAAFLSDKIRIFLIETFQAHLILLGANLSVFFKREFPFWKTTAGSRSCINKEVLESLDLI